MSRVLLVVVMCAISSLAAFPATKQSKYGSSKHKDRNLRQHTSSSVTNPRPARASGPNAIEKSGQSAKTNSVDKQLTNLERQTVKAQAPSRGRKANQKLAAALAQKPTKGDRNSPINFQGSSHNTTTKLQQSSAKRGGSPGLGHKATRLH